MEVLRAHERAGMSETERAAADAVIDLDADENECPACGESIPRGSRRCPGCRLAFG